MRDRSQERGQRHGRGEHERERGGHDRSRERERYEFQRQPQQQAGYGRERDYGSERGFERRSYQAYGDEERPQRFREQGYGEFGGRQSGGQWEQGQRGGQEWEQQGREQWGERLGEQFGMGRRSGWAGSGQGWQREHDEGRGFGRSGSEREGYGRQFQQGELGGHYNYGQEASQRHFGLARAGYQEGEARYGEEESGSEMRGLKRMFSNAGRGPKGYQRSDERIREDVCEMLTQDADVDASEIEIVVAQGEVTLSGCVDDRHAKRRAEDIAESAPGVKQVHNELRVEQHENRGQQYQQGQQSRQLQQGEQSQGRQGDERGKSARTH